MIDKVPLGQIVALVDEVRQDILLSAEHHMDNKGSLWLQSNFPHVMSELEAKTLGWALVPKTIVCSANVLKGMVSAYRTTISYDDKKIYQNNLVSLLDYLESQIYPLLLRMPDDTKKEVETDAFAEAFAEDDIESDDRGPDG